MIRCLLIQITRNRRGQPIREQRLIAGDSLRVGRGTDCNIHLPDPRVKLHHATIKHADDGKLHIEGNGAALAINGVFEQKGELRSAMRILVTPYEFIVEPCSGDHDLVLTLELVQPLPDDRQEIKARARTTLAEAGLSKRGVGLWLAAFIVLVFLVLPVLSAVVPELRWATAHLPVTLDESWNPGALSAGHQSFGKHCNECHQKPFTHVQDQACENCHKNVADHIEVQALQTSVFGETRCAECHRDHKGLKGLVRTDASLCVACHGNIKTLNVKTALPDIHDFVHDHPAFQLSFKTGAEKNDVVRILQTDKDKLVEKSGLKFPHDVHLVKNGVKSPTGNVVMECKHCHTPDDAGMRFMAINMKKHCVECHRLEFEPAAIERQAPHGSEREVMTMLREFYAGIAIGKTPIDVVTVDGLLRRPNDARREVLHQRALDWANLKAAKVAEDLFEVRVCTECHDVKRVAANADVPWKVAPVNIADHWLPKSRFKHVKHRSFACADCHKAADSKQSSDVLIPDIKKCRECHVGSQPARNKVASTCELCHGFHVGIPPRTPTPATAHTPALPGATSMLRFDPSSVR